MGQDEVKEICDVAKLTPMMRQWFDLKGQAENAILFFRMGDFFEIFGDDAETVAPKLDLVLTSRERGDKKKIPFCGVPHHSAKAYWLKLLKQGFKVAIADQVEDPAEAKGLVRREITKTYTPGCVEDLEGLEADEANYLMGLYEDPSTRLWAIALCDISTGEFRLGGIKTIDELPTLIRRFRPREILTRQFNREEVEARLAHAAAELGICFENLPEAVLRDESAQKEMLQEVFGKADLKSQLSGNVEGGLALVGAIIDHLQKLKFSLKQFMIIRPLSDPETFALTEAVIRDLEIFETARRRQTQGSLFRELNMTQSPMGARLLRYNITHPLLNPEQIANRHNAIEALLKLGEERLGEVRTQLKGSPDLERLLARICSGMASPHEMARAKESLEHARFLVEKVTGKKAEHLPGKVYKSIVAGLKFYTHPLKILSGALCDNPGPLGKGMGVIKPGYDPDLDRDTELAENGSAKVDAYQEKLRSETGIASLKIKNHKTFGLLIEVTKANLSKVPEDFIRRQTMVNNERFVTVELKELDEELQNAQINAINREAQIYQQIMLEVSKFRSDLRSCAQALATFDMLASFAWLALKRNFCKPVLSKTGALSLEKSRHPVVERFVGQHAFVANDVTMSKDKKHILITGPNMAGKSTVMRQTAIIAILNQMGCYVPASKAELPIFDNIFTRVGAADDLSLGQSTFMVEMSEAAQILRESTKNSLLILDEVGRGTSTQDGLALATAILEDLLKRVQAYSLFATHYHELVPFAQAYESIRVMQTEVIRDQSQIHFTHRLVPGASGHSYGIEVAKLAGLPNAVIKSAEAHLGHQPQPESRTQPTSEQPSEFKAGTVDAIIAEKIRRTNVNRLTPLQALNFLAELQSGHQDTSQGGLFSE